MNDDANINFRASSSSYFYLSTIYFVLGLIFIWCAFYRQGNDGWKSGIKGIEIGAVSISVGAAWVIWLRGFRLVTNNGVLTYRNGLFRSRSCLLRNIQSHENKWIQWNFFGRHLQVPRLVLLVKDEQSMVINTKPFRRSDLLLFKRLLDEYKN